MTQGIHADCTTNADLAKVNFPKARAGRKPLPSNKKRQRINTTVSAKSYAFIQERTGGTFDWPQGKVIDWLVEVYQDAMKRHERERAERKANYGRLGFGKQS